MLFFASAFCGEPPNAGLTGIRPVACERVTAHGVVRELFSCQRIVRKVCSGLPVFGQLGGVQRVGGAGPWGGGSSTEPGRGGIRAGKVDRARRYRRARRGNVASGSGFRRRKIHSGRWHGPAGRGNEAPAGAG